MKSKNNYTQRCIQKIAVKVLKQKHINKLEVSKKPKS